MMTLICSLSFLEVKHCCFLCVSLKSSTESTEGAENAKESSHTFSRGGPASSQHRSRRFRQFKSNRAHLHHCHHSRRGTTPTTRTHRDAERRGPRILGPRRTSSSSAVPHCHSVTVSAGGSDRGLHRPVARYLPTAGGPTGTTS